MGGRRRRWMTSRPNLARRRNKARRTRLWTQHNLELSPQVPAHGYDRSNRTALRLLHGVLAFSSHCFHGMMCAAATYAYECVPGVSPLSPCAPVALAPLLCHGRWLCAPLEPSSHLSPSCAYHWHPSTLRRWQVQCLWPIFAAPVEFPSGRITRTPCGKARIRLLAHAGCC